MRITQSCISPKTLWRRSCLGTLISTTWSSERGTAKLQAALALNSSYPSIPFIFQLSLNWKQGKNNSNDDTAWAMESKVSVCYKELCGPWHSHQLLTNNYSTCAGGWTST